MKKVNYLNNRDLLHEIHQSKISYCVFLKPEYHQYDMIVHGITGINDLVIEEAKQNAAKRLSHLNFIQAKTLDDKVRIGDCVTLPEDIKKTDLIFRVMTFDHIPDEAGRKKTIKTVADGKTRVNFPPFQHFKFTEDDELVCVGKSHWIGDLYDGEFSKLHGKMTNTLALMFMKLTERYSTRGNVRSYTYVDEMRSQALLQLMQIGLQFDESKSDNPFAYFTSSITNSFLRILNQEKKMQNIRDDLLQANNLSPSYTRTTSYQYDNELRRNHENDV